MTDLPDPAVPAGNNPISTNPPAGGPIDQSSNGHVGQQVIGSVNKEAGIGGSVEVGPPAGEAGLRDTSGQEMELPKEVASIGVSVQPTTIPIPPPVQQMGVAPTGANVPSVSAKQQGVPLTDDQIVYGLKQGVTTSLRWLSEWCVRRIKQLHHAMTYGRKIT